MFSFFVFLLSLTFADDIQLNKSSLIFNYGWTQPIFGDFNDFKGNFSYSFVYLRDYDDLVSYGIQLGDTLFFKNKPTGLKIKFFSLLPTVALKSDYKKNGILYLGFGVYHWSSPSKDIYPSTSDDDFGFKFGYVKTFFNRKIKLSFGIEWSYVIGVKGYNFNLDNVNTFTPVLHLRYDFK